jgi:hypothetical protein
MGCHIPNKFKIIFLLIFTFGAEGAFGQATPTPSPVGSATAAPTPLTLSFAGASNYINTSGAISVYYSNIFASDTGLGLAGNYYAWNPAGGGPCNKNLNAQCVQASSQFTITATDNKATSGSPQFWIVAPPSGTTPQPTNPIAGLGKVAQFGYSGANSLTNYTIPFSTICASAGMATYGVDNNCNPTSITEPFTPILVTMYAIADANGNGILDSGEDVQPFTFTIDSTILMNSSNAESVGIVSFQLFPGDEQAHVRTVVPTQFLTFLYTTGPDIVSNFTPATFNSLVPAAAGVAPTYSLATIAIGTDGSYASEYINGLQNQVSYYFRAAITDLAGNLGYVTLPADDTPSTTWNLPAHAVKPDQIAGLLVNSGTCFIATAAYGSPMAKEVILFRQFRDKILMPTRNGQKFIRWYYNNGQVWADRIRDHKDVRAIVRAFLYPVLGYTWLALKIGAYNASLFLATLLLLPFLFFRFKRGIYKEDLS